MDSISEMIGGVRQQVEPSELDAPSLQQVIEHCLECQTVCSMCADACTSHDDVAALRRCIRLNLDCADLCATAVRLLSRSGTTDLTAMRALLESCASICSSCAVECRKHAAEHEHCGICAETCERGARACQNALETLFEGPSA